MNINDTEFLKKLRSTFEIEAQDHLRTIYLSIIDLEGITDKNEKKSIVEIIHREFHSLKGASRAVGIAEIESICHAIENIFTDVKNGSLNLNENIFDAVNKALDAIEEIISLPENKNIDISSIMKELTKIKSNGKIENSKTTEEKGNLVLKHEEVKKQIPKFIKLSEEKKIDVIRVSKAKLDSLLLQGEELLYAKLSAVERSKEIRELKGLVSECKIKCNGSYMESIEKEVENLLMSAENDQRTIETMLNTFMEDIKDIMLMPFSSIIEIFPKMVRDLSRQLGKEIDFISNGTEIEIDRRILEEIKDPLMHIIRNSIDHGIENVRERKKLKKPSKGKIALNIIPLSGDVIKIEIEDDGEGIDINKLKEKAAKKKIFSEEKASLIGDKEAKMLIFESGFSTSDIITDISGRGLGLAIVREKIQKLNGKIKVDTEKGKGTKISIMLPISISTNRGIIIKVTEQFFVIPTSKVEKVLRIKSSDVKVIEDISTVLIDECIVPIFSLEDILEINKGEKNNEKEYISILVVSDMEKKVAFSIDEVIIEQEVLVKRFNKQLTRVRNISGATILGSGDVVPILNVQDLVKSSLKYRNKSLKSSKSSLADKNEKKSIIVVEDSITSRTLLKNILEGYGYSVKTAVDGVDGWRLLKSEKVDLLITDVEMPRMDGFELTSKVRNNKEFSKLPVILVTSLESREDKERGIDVGASAYIVKSDFQQNSLIETIKRLI